MTVIYIYIYINNKSNSTKKKESTSCKKRGKKHRCMCATVQVLFGEQYLMGLLVKLDGDLYRNGRG
jgi:hypothetical protein